MHEWGDEWFQKYGDQLYKAISEIEHYLRKHGIGVCGKEKWGCYRNEYLQFWNGGIYQILFGYRAYIGPYSLSKHPKLEKFMQTVHKFIYYKIDIAIPDIPEGTPIEEFHNYYDKRIWKGLTYINEKIGLVKLVHKYQAYHFNKIFQITCKKYPDIIDELISEIDGYEMIKPCKWGNVDGIEIHNEYWTIVE